MAEQHRRHESARQGYQVPWKRSHVKNQPVTVEGGHTHQRGGPHQRKAGLNAEHLPTHVDQLRQVRGASPAHRASSHRRPNALRPVCPIMLMSRKHQGSGTTQDHRSSRPTYILARISAFFALCSSCVTRPFSSIVCSFSSFATWSSSSRTMFAGTGVATAATSAGTVKTKL